MESASHPEDPHGRKVLPSAHAVFAPGKIGPLTIRNRIIKTATYEGMSPQGIPSPALTEHHSRLAAGGVGMTTVAYCAVSPNGRTFAEQMVMTEENVERLSTLTRAVHAEGAAVSLQLGHCGFFTKNKELSGPPKGPSRTLNEYGLFAGLPLAAPMTEADMDRTVEDFALAARRAAQAGFDAVEVHLGHGYLLSQFLSPAVNRRHDQYGGSIENRLRFPLRVVNRVLGEVGDRLAVLAKINLSDGFARGLGIDDAVVVAGELERCGTHALVLSGGFTSKTPLFLLRGGRPLASMIAVEKNRWQRLALRVFGPSVVRAYPFEEMFFLPLARRVRQTVAMPLVLLGGVVSMDNLDVAMQEGFDFVAMGRALIADPTLVSDLKSGKKTRTRCNNCNECIAEMDAGGVRCVLDGPRAGATS